MEHKPIIQNAPKSLGEIKPDGRPPYLFGLLCIIPLVGACVGFFMVLFGIFKYRDKWMIIIGSAGIAVTVALYSALFYYSFNNDFAKEGFAKISQSQLNDLMKKVEFYKLQHGFYPDSLAQAIKGDEFTSINDTSQKDLAPYNYEKTGDKYYLFSSGPDGVPNTRDDVYPKIEGPDNGKFGLLHK